MWKKLGNELSKKRLVKWLSSLGSGLGWVFFITMYSHIHLTVGECSLGNAVALVQWDVVSSVGVPRNHNLEMQRGTMNFS